MCFGEISVVNLISRRLSFPFTFLISSRNRCRRRQPAPLTWLQSRLLHGLACAHQKTLRITRLCWVDGADRDSFAASAQRFASQPDDPTSARLQKGNKGVWYCAIRSTVDKKTRGVACKWFGYERSSRAFTALWETSQPLRMSSSHPQSLLF